MGLLSDIGVATGFAANRVWRLTSLDDSKVKFVGQFPAQELTENVGAQFGTTGTIGAQTFSLQWLSGDQETFQFQARIFRTSPIKGAIFDALSNPVSTVLGAAAAFDSGDGLPDLVGNGSVRDEIEKLKSFARATDVNGKPNSMGRPHRFLFTAGTELEFSVFVRSVGGVKYDDLRSDGTIRGALFTITLEKTQAENLKLASAAGVSMAALLKTGFGVITSIAGAAGLGSFNPASVINIPGGSLHTIGKSIKVKQGMSFESIARAEYGNPMLGDVLRRTQPDKVNLVPGDDIILVRAEEIVQIPITPQSVALKDTTDNKALIKNYLAARGNPAAIVA